MSANEISARQGQAPAAGFGQGEMLPRLTSRLRSTAAAITWELLAVVVLLGGAALLFLWNLGASGWANAYYSAAALAGSKSWLAMLFGSFDAGNAITVDKTPASLWVMSLSARIFGVNAWSILVPQAIEGVLAVWLLYLTVRRRVGPMGGLLAGAILALTPVATLMFRFNNPDALLTLLLVVGAYATTRSLERASTKWLIVAGTAIGFAFLAKMLQGFLVIPAFAAVYLLAAPTSMWRRVWQVGVAALSVLVAAGWWMALIMFWPADARPFVGGSQTNSIWDLMLGYNGLGRLTGDEVGRVGGGGGGPFSEGAGWLRLFQGTIASEVSWLLPAALASLVVLLWMTRGAPRTNLTRAHALLWGGWLVVTGLTFSLMEGIFHDYYAVALVPPIGALVGMGAAAAWVRRDQMLARVVAAGTLAGSGWWATVLLGNSPGWNSWLGPVVLAVASLASAAVVALPWLVRALRGAGHLAPGFTAAIAAAVLLAVPGVGAVATAVTAHTGAIPTSQPAANVTSTPGNAGFGRFRGPGPGGAGFGAPGPGASPRFGGNGVLGGFRGGTGAAGGLLDADAANPQLVAALRANAAAYRWVAATTGSNNAAGLALSSGESVMAIGGFNGTDPSPTLAQFQAYVAAGKIHYFIAGGGFGGGPGGSGSNASSEISSWVEANFESTTVGGVTLYDLSGGAS
jgi:4-amino-4-deoxy-L-arabinose transferase-like glycosyltransferase